MDYEITPIRFVGDFGVETAHDAESADGFGLYERLPPDETGARLARWIGDYETEAGAYIAMGWMRLEDFLACARAFLLGVREFRSSVTTNPGEDLIECYDTGRELAHRLTFRRFEES